MMEQMVNNLAIIQARTGATRLPNKVLKEIKGKTVLEHVIERVKRSKFIDEVIVATTINESDLSIVSLCAQKGVRVFCGSENDVLDRFYQISKLINPQNIIRITADCPLHDAEVIDLVVQSHLESKCDYTSNTLKESFPDGLDCEVFTYHALENAWKRAKLASQREHVTQYMIHDDQCSKFSVVGEENHGDERWTLDNEDDFRFIETIYSELYDTDVNFGYRNILNLLDRKPELKSLNNKAIRNEGLFKSLANDYAVN